MKDEINGAAPVHRRRSRSARRSCGSLMGVPIGIVSAIRPGAIFDRAGMLFALFGVSVPVFWLGLLLIYIFHFWLGVAPGTGIPSDESTFKRCSRARSALHPDPDGSLHVAVDHGGGDVGGVLLAPDAKQPDGDDGGGLHPDRARQGPVGADASSTSTGSATRLTPLVTMLGLDIAFLLGGAVITENVFGLPGLGQYALAGHLPERLPGRDGRDGGRRRLHRRREPGRRRRLRRPRSTREVHVRRRRPEACLNPCWRSGTSTSRSPPRTASSRRSTASRSR